MAEDRVGAARDGGPRRVRRAVALLLVAGLAATCGARMPSGGGPGWDSPGLVGGGGWPFAGVPLDADEKEGAAYLPGSSVVRLGDGRVRLVPFGAEKAITVPADDPRVRQAVRSDSHWLARGTVPGRTPADREMAERALLDLRLLTRPNGASLASWYGAWRYAWPRDAAFAAAAFAVTGHMPEARRVLRFLERVQTDEGRWAARYHPDGSAVIDGRAPQLDALGWVVWASWLVHTHDPAGAGRLPELWPMVVRAADQLASSLDSTGLPPPSSDYFERSPDTEQDPDRPTLGVVGPVLAGLRAAADLARDRGDPARASHWRNASLRLSNAVARHFAPYGYPRSPIRGGRMDTSVTFVAPPFAPQDPGVSAAVLNAARRLTLSNGGVLPGEKWAGNRTVAWTPEMAMFALAAASSGRAQEARARLDWLARHRTSLGALPEKVDAKGRPAGVAPLGWTASLVLLTLTALERPLPVPPAT
ncbi:hypothetical protein GCM10022416_35360 [Actinomadura keratinilytica]|uniref:Glycoside hydrolase family 15 n=1 Tax=Actinomadura keratinilytica TaxID=547461 RepID=A0ABP7Z064_9ACTN